MFTGLVEAMGTVRALDAAAAGRRLVVEEAGIAPSLKLGDSVAVSGVCLTVVAMTPPSFAFEVGPETLRVTTLGELRAGDAVNLERSLALGDRLGGHLVQGHIDGVGTIRSRERSGEWEMVAFTCARELTRLMIPKGSIAVDGISLTLVEVWPDGFNVALIPHTLAATTLGTKAVGAAVNLETDMIGRYLRKFWDEMQVPA